MSDHWHIGAGTVTGATIASLLARAYIIKSLKDLHKAIASIEKLNIKITALSVKLENLDRLQVLVHELDHKVIALEAKLHAAK